MCLITFQTAPFKTGWDIKVYKVLTTNNEPPVYGGQTYVYHYGINEPDGITPKQIFYKKTLRYTEIYGGFLHAFTSKKHAKALRDHYNRSAKSAGDATRYKMVQMVIPAGTDYYAGTQFDICSSALRWDPEETLSQKLKNLFHKAKKI